MTDRELMQQALDALESDCGATKSWIAEALRTRLSQCDRCGEVNPAEIHTCTPKEPVGWEKGNYGISFKEPMPHANYKITATVAPQREDGCAGCGKKSSEGWALYCVKCIEPVRTWAGLTDEEMEEAMKYWSDPCRSAYGGAEAADDEYVDMIGTWRYIEAKLKEKNT